MTSWGNSEADADGILSKQFYSKRYGCNLLATEDTGFGDTSKGCYYTGWANAEVDAAVEGGKTDVNPANRQAHYALLKSMANWIKFTAGYLAQTG